MTLNYFKIHNFLMISFFLVYNILYLCHKIMSFTIGNKCILLINMNGFKCMRNFYFAKCAYVVASADCPGLYILLYIDKNLVIDHNAQYVIWDKIENL